MNETEHTFGSQRWQKPVVVMIAGCLICLIGFGARSTFGLFLTPMSGAMEWDRETFALAMAIQNLLWGLMMPVAGILADRYGYVLVIIGGALVYALGLWGMAFTDSITILHLTAGVLTGVGVSFTSFTLISTAMVRVVGPEKRSLVFGVGTAATSFGQVLFSPITQGVIDGYGWESGIFFLFFSILIILPLALLLPFSPGVKGEKETGQTISEAIREAAQHRGFILLTTGFFVCGFHVAFIGIHFPAYVTDLGFAPRVGAWSIALIGIFNIVGSILSGLYGRRGVKKLGLSFIYAARAVVILVLLVMPKTELSLYLFAAAMGLLWLSTVPLTNMVVAQIFGVRYMATLYGFVFVSHQLGSFLGVWLGGFLYDMTGTYDLVWYAGIVLGIVAALVHLPINEAPLARLVAVPAGEGVGNIPSR
jgi:MFS family permease